MSGHEACKIEDRIEKTNCWAGQCIFSSNTIWKWIKNIINRHQRRNINQSSKRLVIVQIWGDLPMPSYFGSDSEKFSLSDSFLDIWSQGHCNRHWCPDSRRLAYLEQIWTAMVTINSFCTLGSWFCCYNHSVKQWQLTQMLHFSDLIMFCLLGCDPHFWRVSYSGKTLSSCVKFTLWIEIWYILTPFYLLKGRVSPRNFYSWIWPVGHKKCGNGRWNVCKKCGKDWKTVPT